MNPFVEVICADTGGTTAETDFGQIDFGQTNFGANWLFSLVRPSS